MKSGEARDRLLDAVHRRAETLARCTAPDHQARHVDVVLTMMATNLLKTLLVLLGETLSMEWASLIFDNFAESQGICRFCHARVLIAENGMCQVCWDGVEADERYAELAAAMDEPRRGGIA